MRLANNYMEGDFMEKFKARKAALASLILLGIFMVLPGCGRWDKPVPSPATVSTTVPANGASAAPTGNKLTATFSEPMDSASFNDSSFALSHGGIKDLGQVSYDGVTAVYTPQGPLLAGTLYTATLSTAIRDAHGLALASDYTWSFTTDSAADSTKPTVSSSSPDADATGVPIISKLSISFSEPMDPASINPSHIGLKQGTTDIAGSLSYANVTAVFTPAQPLAADTLYTATVGLGVKDLGGNPLAESYSFSFRTAAAQAPLVRPTVLSTVPGDGVTGVPIGNKLFATFSAPMDPLTITTTSFSLKRGTVNVPGNVASTGANASFTPTSQLLPSTLYSATITTGASDLAGSALAANVVWSFTTGASASLVRPSLTLTGPVDGAGNVPANTKITATFSEAMDPLTITTANFGVAGVTGTVTYNSATRTATLTPTLNLAGGSTYTATVKAGAQDSAGNALTTGLIPNPWTFTTEATPVVPPAVNLLSVVAFGAAGGTGVTSCGNTVITGDVSTTSAPTLITGLTDLNGLGNSYSIGGCPGIVNGNIYTAPPAPGTAASMAIATQAQLDAQTAFNATSPAAMPGGVTQTAELGGLTLAPGVYWTGTSFNITSVDLVLDGKGDPNASWVFQSDSSLTVGTNVKIILTNSAQAKNVFWHIASKATLNAGCQMKGSILAFSGVTMGTGARLDGRAISLVGGPVTLLSNIINIP
jgi:hypothetical protein